MCVDVLKGENCRDIGENIIYMLKTPKNLGKLFTSIIGCHQYRDHNISLKFINITTNKETLNNLLVQIIV